MTDEETVCVKVHYPSGKEIWESLRDYRTNPSPGSYIVKDERTVPPDGLSQAVNA